VEVDLTDEQWAVIEPHLSAPERNARCGPRGGGSFRDARGVMNGVLWVLRTGAPWADLPARYPPYQTCHRRFQRWVEDGTLKHLLAVLAEDLRERGKLDLTEAFIDGTHAGAKKGASMLGETAAARRPRSWQWQTAMVFLSPLGLRVVSDMKHRSPEPPSSPASSKSSRSG
jgi:transposase